MVSKDRAALFTDAILGIFADTLRAWSGGEPTSLADVRGDVDALVREEFADLKREVAGERIAGLD